MFGGRAQSMRGVRRRQLPHRPRRLFAKRLDATRWGDPHHSQPSVLSLTVPSDHGTVYTPHRSPTCRDRAERGPARPPRRRTARQRHRRAGCTPADITWRAGIDAFSLGATKNGVTQHRRDRLLRPRRLRATRLPASSEPATLRRRCASSPCNSPRVPDRRAVAAARRTVQRGDGHGSLTGLRRARRRDAQRSRRQHAVRPARARCRSIDMAEAAVCSSTGWRTTRSGWSPASRPPTIEIDEALCA